jgi:hypothetical protein
MQDRTLGIGACEVVAELELADALNLASLLLEVGGGVVFGETLDGSADVGVSGPARCWRPRVIQTPTERAPAVPGPSCCVVYVAALMERISNA